MDRRTYRSSTGDLAVLEHGRVAGPDRQLWSSVSPLRADSPVPPVARQPPVARYKTPDEAREGYRYRLVALRGEA